MSFGMGIIVGAIGMLFLQFGALGVFALREIFKGSRKELNGIETTKEIDS